MPWASSVGLRVLDPRTPGVPDSLLLEGCTTPNGYASEKRGLPRRGHDGLSAPPPCSGVRDRPARSILFPRPSLPSMPFSSVGFAVPSSAAPEPSLRSWRSLLWRFWNARHFSGPRLLCLPIRSWRPLDAEERSRPAPPRPRGGWKSTPGSEAQRQGGAPRGSPGPASPRSCYQAARAMGGRPRRPRGWGPF